MTFRSLYRILAIATPLQNVQAQCFWPDGTPSDQYIVCNRDSNDTYSSCCATNDMCTTNGLCKNANDDRNNNFYWRTTCNDPLWQSPNCPKYCTTSDRSPGKPWNNSHMVWACSQTTYCCSPWKWPGAVIPTRNPRYDCCNDSAAVFDAGPADFLSGRIFTTSLFPVTAITASSTSSLTQSTTTSASSTSATPDSVSEGMSTGATAGIGIGAAIGVLLLVAAAIWWAKRSQAPRGIRAKKQYTTLLETEPQLLVDTTELPAWANSGEVSEADSNRRHELESLQAQVPVELAAQKSIVRRELP